MRTKRNKGFTLIENIIAMTLMGFAMMMLITLLYPVLHRFAEQQAYTKASALAQTVMNIVLAYSFDHYSDHSGDIYRCDEANASGVTIKCSSYNGAELGETQVADYNDVDDFYGCWYVNEGQRQYCEDLGYGIHMNPIHQPGAMLQPLSALLGMSESEMETAFSGLRVFIAIRPYPDESGANVHPVKLKKIEVYVTALSENNVDVKLIALRGNY